MNLLMSIGSWFAENWMILLILVLAILFLVPSYLKQKKEINNRNELTNSIKKGTKIVTTAGVYGVVESIEETTDGKVVTISTGSKKSPSSMTIHINAIMGIDNKTLVAETKEQTKDEEIEEKVKEEKSSEKESSKAESDE